MRVARAIGRPREALTQLDLLPPEQAQKLGPFYTRSRANTHDGVPASLSTVLTF